MPITCSKPIKLCLGMDMYRYFASMFLVQLLSTNICQDSSLPSTAYNFNSMYNCLAEHLHFLLSTFAKNFLDSRWI